MVLAQLPLDCAPHVVADWFEFHVITSEFGTASFNELQRMWDTRRNAEGASPDGRRDVSTGNDGDEQFVETILNEVRERIEYLNDAYPFEFNTSGQSLQLKNELGVGQNVYLFCLLLSSAKKAEIFELDKFSYELTNFVRDLFQACSAWAAAGVVNGSSCSFGFPRPDGSNFLNKLRETYALIGEGAVREEPLPGVSSSPKDEGIDIIAWGRRPDRAPGRQYMLGQVATGDNWPGKSVVEYIKPFHENWFSDIPSSLPTHAMFVPHCIERGDATLQQRLHILTKRYGHFYYRYIIPSLAKIGHELGATEAVSVDRIDDIDRVKTWVDDTLMSMRAAAMGA
ncbi:MAG: hypothetical protein RBS05_06605 [Zoogloea oleivorans]|jgi:hypothetical protein|uniref:hypothetical protein n=1 Tax=Zoogloea oleivorans TaxID=1552750 RepID=UPI002A35AAFE|nr:hypothetical protein [Zoogloea oleivorans]MDY0035564.1 hypothetical protein [Zoogloea oleivorans]